MIRQGQLVATPRGPGKVAYVRMAPPDYTEPAAVSVVLDARSEDGRYAGTIMDAALVTPIGGAPCPVHWCDLDDDHATACESIVDGAAS